VPQGGEIALHRQFIADPKNKATNATAALHLDETRGCYSCHINLDPLASALSRNFLPFVQVDEVNGMYGEFGLSGGGMHAYSVYILGMRNGDSAGNGAFLGKPASGVVAVGQILADSDMPYACATRRAFQEIYGRPPLIADAELVRATSKSFFNHKDFSRMIRELITNGSFGRDN
jgi:hypothetical protein